VEWSVSELSPVLGVIGKLDCVVIGGQAVNIWCEHYARENYVPAGQWDELKPFTSLDLDLLGSSVEAEEAGVELHANRVEIAVSFSKSDSLVLREAELVNRVDQCLETELLKVLSIARIKRIHGVAQQGDSQQRVKGLSRVEPG